MGDSSSKDSSTSRATGFSETVAWKSPSKSEGANKAEGSTGKPVLVVVVVMVIKGENTQNPVKQRDPAKWRDLPKHRWLAAKQVEEGPGKRNLANQELTDQMQV